MAHDRAEHVDEASPSMGPDRFALERLDQTERARALRGDGEVVGPERHPALAEGGVGLDHRAGAQAAIARIRRTPFPAQQTADARFAFALAQILELGLPFPARRRFRKRRRNVHAADLDHRPAAGVRRDGRDLPRLGAEAETGERVGGEGGHWVSDLGGLI